MPSRGDRLHTYLKKEAGKRILKIYKEQIDFIKFEQPQNEHVKEQNYFKVRVTLGSDWHDSLDVENLNFPDMLVQINLTEKEKKHLRATRKDSIPDKKIVIVECETSQSPLVISRKTPRYYAYKLVKEKHKDDIIFILVTFEGIKVKTDLFDHVWRFKRP